MPRYFLRVLGGLSIEADATLVSGTASQRKRLALLAMLAVAGDLGLSRDKVLALLWAESDEARARNALDQLLYGSRRELGPVLLSLGGTLRLDATLIDSDIAEFERARHSARLEAAVACYRGPFLDGVHLRDAPEFDGWVERERTRLEAAYLDVLESLARRASLSGDGADAVRWWRTRASAEPSSPRAARAYMEALVAHGDREAALRHAEAYARYVRSEFDDEPEPAVLQYASLLSSAKAAESEVFSRAQQGRLADAVSSSASDDAADVATRPQPQAGVLSARPISRRSHWRWLAGASLVLATLGLGASRFLNHRGGSPSARMEKLVVIPFVSSDAHDSGAIAPGLTPLLTASLAELRLVDVSQSAVGNASDGPDVTAEGLLTRPPLAVRWARTHASRYLITGAVARNGTLLDVSAALYDAEQIESREPAAPIAKTTIEGPATDLPRMVVRLTAALLPRLFGPAGGRLARAAASSTAPVSAVRRYLLGEAQYRLGHFAQSVDEFSAAVKDDSSFAVAWYRLSVACDWASRVACSLDAADHAAALASALDEHDRLLLEALRAWHRADREAAERLYGYITRMYPDDAEAWYQLGDARFHLGPGTGFPIEESRLAFERVLALDPGNREALIHLARLATIAADRVGADTLYSAAIASGDTLHTEELRVARAFATGDSAMILAWLKKSAAYESDDFLSLVAMRLVLFGEDRAGARLVLNVLARPNRTPDARAAAHVGLADLLLIEGRAFAADSELRLAQGLAGDSPSAEAARDRRRLLRELPEFGRAFAAANPRDSLDTRTRGLWRDDAFLRGLQAVDLAERRPADSLTMVLLQWPQNDSPDSALASANVLRAAQNLATGRLEDALIDFDEQSTTTPLWYAVKPLSRYIHAMALERLGRKDEALRWYSTFERVTPGDAIFAAPAEYRRGRIFEARGEGLLASEAYKKAIELWQQCDEPLRPMIGDARSRLHQLVGGVR